MFKRRSVLSVKKIVYLLATIAFAALMASACIFFKSSHCNRSKPGSGEDPSKSIEAPQGYVTRDPYVAGGFYPGEPSLLNTKVNKYLKNAKKLSIKNFRGIVVPHAGYIYSGQVAAHAYANLDKNIKRVFIIASNHSREAPPFKCSISVHDYYRTPSGKIKVSEVAKKFLSRKLCTYVPQAHTTHVIEVQLPFLQRVLSDFEIIPIIIGGANFNELMNLAEAVNEHFDEKSLIIASSDLSHFHPYKEAVKLDRSCISAIERQSIDKVIRCEACGTAAILILLEISSKEGWTSIALDYKNSGDTAGSKDSVVGYSSIAFYEEGLSDKDKKKLLEFSKNVLHTFIRKNTFPKINKSNFPKTVFKKQGCFVTLKKNHQLRGCIGHILPHAPLLDCIRENTVNAALSDSRFKPVSADELRDINIEISVLSVPSKLKAITPEKRLGALVPKKHGVILKNGFNQSTYLPQVWEDLPEKEYFLKRLCIKGGMNGDCWKDPETEIYTYEATVF